LALFPLDFVDFDILLEVSLLPANKVFIVVHLQRRR